MIIEDLPCGGACLGTGILHAHTENVLDLAQVTDVDNIARCDACHFDMSRPSDFSGDFEAARFVAASTSYGAWLVYINDLNVGPPATEAPQLYVRHDFRNVANLQKILIEQAPTDEDDVPEWVVMVEFVNPT